MALKLTRNSNELTSFNRCVKKKKYSFIVDTDADIIKKAVAEKTTVMQMLNSLERKTYLANKTEANKKALVQATQALLEDEYAKADFSFDLETQKNQIIREMTACISRYVMSEIRTPISKSFTPRIDFTLPELDDVISIKPDIVYYTNENNTDCIEAIIIKTGKSTNFAYKSEKKDSSPEKSLELYLLWCYARLLAKPNKTTIIKASYYFLKSPDDFKKNIFLSESDYFMAKSVIFTLQDSVTKDANGNYKLSYTDVSFKDQLIEFNEGMLPSECKEEDCKNCPLNPFCNYNIAPVCKVNEKKTSKMRAVDFSPAQLEVINFRKGYGIVNAGAGAGKTAVVTYCVETYAEEGGKEEDILCITFTNNGAAEMKSRIEATLIDNGMETIWDISKVQIKTFNAFCNDIICNEYEKLGFTAPPTLIEDDEKYAIIKSLQDKYVFDGINPSTFMDDSIGMYYATGKEIVSFAFDYIKTNRLSAGDENLLKEGLSGKYFSSMNNSITCLTQLLRAYNEYDALLKLNNLIEYADQELLLLDLLQLDPYYLDKFGFKHIIVDEFQDTSAQQMEILKLIIDTPSFESILVVGDDSQAIYGFRGTGPEHLINFFDEVDAPENERFVFNLVDNYRCTPEIIDAANKIIKKNEKRVLKDLIAYRPSINKPVIVKGFYEKQEEYTYIVDSIKKKIASGVEPDQIAVLGRNKNIIAKIGELLAKENIPCVNMNPELIFENSKVIAAIELAKAINNPTLDRSIMIYLNCKYENTLLDFTPDEIKEEIEAFRDRIQKLLQLPEKEKIEEFMSLLDDIDYDSDELYEAFIEKIKRKPTFKMQYERIKLIERYGKKQTYKREKDYPGVVLTTMHSAKGLEWENVYMITDGLDEEAFHKNSRKKQKEIEETRRLIFVSMTRARDELVITGLFNINEKKDIINQFLKEIYEVLGKEEEYANTYKDPNAEYKKALKEIAKAEAKAEAAKRKADMLQKADESELTSLKEGVLNPLDEKLAPAIVSVA